MMRVTNTTFGMLQQIRHEENRKNIKTAVLQYRLKSGKWSKPREYRMYGSEQTAEDVLKRMTRNNPGDEFRIAE